MFKGTKPFKNTITGHENEPSLRIGKAVPSNAVNLAYYINPTATDTEKILAADPPRNTIDHRIESQTITKLDQASGPNGEEPSNDIFPLAIYYSDEEGYYGRLKRQDNTIHWYPNKHVNQKEAVKNNEQIVANKGDEDKYYEYNDADGYKGNLYLDAVTYEVDAVKDASTKEEVDYTIENYELNYHDIFNTYLNSDTINKGIFTEEPNPVSNSSSFWPARIELTATKLIASGGNNSVANYVNRQPNDWEGANEQFINDENIISSSKPIGYLYFDKLEYSPVAYQDKPKDGSISEEREIGTIRSDDFPWNVTVASDQLSYQNHLPGWDNVKINGITPKKQYLAKMGEDYSEIEDFLNLISQSNPSAFAIVTIQKAIEEKKDIAIWISNLKFVVNDKSIDMLRDGSVFKGNAENEIQPTEEPSPCHFELGYKYVISDRGDEGTLLYNIIAVYHTVKLENGKCSVTRTITTHKEEATRYKAICHYSGLVNKNWTTYDGIATYMGSVTKGNAIGNQNAELDNEILMFPDKNGYLRQIVDGLKVETGSDNRPVYSTEKRNYYRVEADSVYLTDVFDDGKACFYKYKLKQPIYDYRGPDQDGFYKGDAVQIYTSTLKEIPSDYKHNIKLVPAEYEEITTYDTYNNPVVTKRPKCYYAELYTSFISSSTDTFKVVYNGFNNIKDDNIVLNNGLQEDIYNHPYMINGIDYQLKRIDENARLSQIQILNYEPLKDDRRRITFKWKVVATKKTGSQENTEDTEIVFETKEYQSSILNKDYALPCEYNLFEERGMIISPRLNGDSNYCSPRDLCLDDQASKQKADKDFETVISDTDTGFIYHAVITEINAEGSVNLRCNPDGSGVVTAETTLDTGFYNEVRSSYTNKLSMENPYYTDGEYIYKGYKVKCIDARTIKVKAPLEEGLLDSWYPLIQFGHYSRILDQYGAHTKICYSMPEYDKQHFSDVYGKPYVGIKHEQATVINPHMIKTKHYPLHIIEPALDEDTYIFNGKYYKVIKKTESWKDAEKDCQKLGGHLAMPKSQAEMDFLVEVANKYQLGGLWLGMTDEEEEGKWKYADKTSVIYTNWNTGEPNNLHNEEHYCEIYTSGDTAGLWNDLANNSISAIDGYICEFTGTISVFKKIDNELFKLNIKNISFSDGVIITEEAISENDTIIVDYTYLEENYNYRGYWRDSTDFVRIDLNPNIYHTYNNPKYNPSEVEPSKNLFNKVIYFFMKPSVEYNISSENDSLVYDPQNDKLDGEVMLNNENCLYHKINDAEPDSDMDILVGSVYIRQNTSLHSTIITDARTRGGGIIKEMPDDLRHELEPESDYYLDIGYYDGKPYQENGVIIVRLDNRLLKEYGGRFTVGDVEQKVKRWLGVGIYPIIEFVDSYKKTDLPQYNLEVEDSYSNVVDITPELFIESK